MGVAGYAQHGSSFRKMEKLLSLLAHIICTYIEVDPEKQVIPPSGLIIED